MRIQFSTACLPYYPLGQQFALARTLGADGLELALTPALLLRGSERVVRLSDQHGVPVRSLAVALADISPPEPAETPAIARFAAALPECRVLVLPAPTPTLAPGGLGAYLALLRGYLDALADRGITPTIENPAPRRAGEAAGPLDRFPQLRRLVEEWDLGFTFDTSHAAGHGWVITEPLPQMGARLRNVHLSDFRAPPRGEAVARIGLDDHGYEGHQLPGQGILPLRAFLRALARREYAGLLTLDLDPRGLRAWWPPTARGRLARALDFCHATLQRRDAPPLDPLAPPLEAPAEAENEG